MFMIWMTICMEIVYMMDMYTQQKIRGIMVTFSLFSGGILFIHNLIGSLVFNMDISSFSTYVCPQQMFQYTFSSKNVLFPTVFLKV